MTAQMHTQGTSVYVVTIEYDGKIHHIDMNSVNAPTARALVRTAYPKCVVKKVEVKNEKH